jgi:hypothetical protein
VSRRTWKDTQFPVFYTVDVGQASARLQRVLKRFRDGVRLLHPSFCYWTFGPKTVMLISVLSSAG